MSIRIAIIGMGHIARSEHLPAITAHEDFTLTATVSPHSDPGLAVPWFRDAATMFDRLGDAIDAVALCTPPEARFAIASLAIARGKAVLLEKPPAATLGEAEELVLLAAAAGTSLFTAWHSQHAPAIAPARALLADDPVATLAIEWREDVRRWHPGQEWIWQPGGHGVFDAGINGLSIATRLLPAPMLLQSATLAFPENRQAPIAAELRFDGGDISARFDWRNEGPQCWTVAMTTQSGRRLLIGDGGHSLSVDGNRVDLAARGEYPALYDRFAQLVRTGTSDAEIAPLRIVADAFLIGRRHSVAAFA